MHLAFRTEPAEFLERPNRFLVLARLWASGEVVRAHCPNSGRLRELLIPHAGVTVHLSCVQGDARAAKETRRSTSHELRFVEHADSGCLISLDTRLPNALLAEALRAHGLPPFADLTALEAEAPVPAAPLPAGPVHSRIDFRGADAAGRITWIEAKSVTLVESGTALFPDAVTARGRRHLLELAALARQGDRAAVVFVVQRPDARRVRPHRRSDPAFADALAAAAAAGVELYAWTVRLSLTEATLASPVPVELA